MEDKYPATVARLEPDIIPLDVCASGASIAISLKRIADAFEFLVDEVKKEKQLEEQRRQR